MTDEEKKKADGDNEPVDEIDGIMITTLQEG
jgi:hypothetical protein